MSSTLHVVFEIAILDIYSNCDPMFESRRIILSNFHKNYSFFLVQKTSNQVSADNKHLDRKKKKIKLRRSWYHYEYINQNCENQKICMPTSQLGILT